MEVIAWTSREGDNISNEQLESFILPIREDRSFNVIGTKEENDPEH